LIQQKLDRLHEAFIYKEAIDLGTYERRRDRLREEQRGVIKPAAAQYVDDVLDWRLDRGGAAGSEARPR
jgi:hypothetical protein